MIRKPNMEETVAHSQSQPQPQIEIVNIEDDDVFCFTPISLKRSAEHLEELKGLQSIKAGNFIDLSDETIDFFDDDEELRILRFKPSNTPFGKRRKPFTGPSVTEAGQSSNSKEKQSFVCEICVETKPGNQLFGVENCSHAYCTECTVNYVVSKLQENITNIRCPVPDCKGLLEAEYCRPILPPEVFDRWGSVLCESVILGSEKFYCPFKDCSAMLIDDGKEVIRQSECPNCWRMFCAQCKVPWHEGIECAEFQKLNKDEREKEAVMLRNLAQQKQWRRCPNCKFYVEKSEGCMFMMCRCKTAFCYRCGKNLKANHGHNCPNCRVQAVGEFTLVPSSRADASGVSMAPILSTIQPFQRSLSLQCSCDLKFTILF